MPGPQLEHSAGQRGLISASLQHSTSRIPTVLSRYHPVHTSITFTTRAKLARSWWGLAIIPSSDPVPEMWPRCMRQLPSIAPSFRATNEIVASSNTSASAAWQIDSNHVEFWPVTRGTVKRPCLTGRQALQSRRRVARNYRAEQTYCWLLATRFTALSFRTLQS